MSQLQSQKMHKSASQRLNFTEAVPLSLSSVSHMSIPYADGVLDGIKNILQHTLMACYQYARHRSTAEGGKESIIFRDLVSSRNAWRAVAVNKTKDGGDNDTSVKDQNGLHKLGGITKHQYARHCFIYFKPGADTALDIPQDIELKAFEEWRTGNSSATSMQSDGSHNNADGENVDNHENAVTKSIADNMLGRISLLYTSTEMLTADEMNCLSDKDPNIDIDEIPPIILYKVIAEYKSVPSVTSPSVKSSWAIEAEELSMLSFGGSIDDDVKYGALSSLYDPLAKYVLDIHSVRGKRYKFDIMDSTLSNGTVPKSMPHINKKGSSNGTSDADDNPFTKSLCVTVSDNVSSRVESTTTTKMNLTLEGLLRYGVDKSDNNINGSILPKTFTLYPKILIDTFTLLDPYRSSLKTSATCMPSKQTLLLEPKQAGKVFINGKYVTTWGTDINSGSIDTPALFGFDLLGVPIWHGRIINYELLKYEYIKLWQEIMIDGSNRFQHLYITEKLLSRLMYGHDYIAPTTTTTTTKTSFKKKLFRNGDSISNKMDVDTDEDDDDDEEEDVDLLYDDVDDDEESMDDGNNGSNDASNINPKMSENVNVDCLESQLMSSSKYDPVGICAKALATAFQKQFGKIGYPTLEHEIDYVTEHLGDRMPVVVPQRLINILRRGGYFDVKRHEHDLVWFKPNDEDQGKSGEKKNDDSNDDTIEKGLIGSCINLLKKAKCFDTENDIISPDKIRFIDSKRFFVPPRMSLMTTVASAAVLGSCTTCETDGNSGKSCSNDNETYNDNPMVGNKVMCRYDESSRQYHVNDAILTMSLPGSGDETEITRAYLLGMYIAQEHPDGNILVRYLLKHSSFIK